MRKHACAGMNRKYFLIFFSALPFRILFDIHSFCRHRIRVVSWRIKFNLLLSAGIRYLLQNVPSGLQLASNS
jgi:hypothetical protein